MGVLWAGAKASKVIKEGKHRVRASARPRLSCWHELCTNQQITPPMLERIASQDMELQMGAVKGTRKVLRTLRRAEDHKLKTKVPRDLMMGAPISKSGVERMRRIPKDMLG